ncbi:MAG: orotate phosphoribosyltransferase [Planctomycetota bacterium]|nr:orotate phosphoribosyltransferase [Planctomycetota bacterium]
MTSATAEGSLREALQRTGALLSGHFGLSSGLHSDQYIQCARLLAHPGEAEVAGAALAGKLLDLLHGEKPDLVVGPALGGIIVAHEVARCLAVPCLFTERKNGSMTLRRGFEISQGAKVVVVEDVVTTGGSAAEVVSLLQSMEASVAAVGSLVCRSAASPFSVPYTALLDVPAQAWEVDDCPQCREGLSLDKPGSRPGA